MKIKTKKLFFSCVKMYMAALVMISAAVLIVPTTVTAVSETTLEGVIQGAGCVHFKRECPEDDAHIAMERDFVLLLPNGEHYFLPNLDRAIKARYAGKSVRISGEREDHEIWAKSLDVKKDGKYYLNVWSWQKQQELYRGGGGN